MKRYKKQKFQFVATDKYDEYYNEDISYLDSFINCKAKLLQDNDIGYIRHYYDEGSDGSCNSISFYYFESLNNQISLDFFGAIKKQIHISDVELLEDDVEKITLFNILQRLYNKQCGRCNTFVLSENDSELIEFVNIKAYKYIITDYKNFCNEYCETHNGKTMDFGKHEGELLSNIPLDYLQWIYNKIKGEKHWGVQAHKLREELKRRDAFISTSKRRY